jgi:hypothetical protein
VNILTVPQFALLKYAWRHGSFTVAEIHASGECGEVTPETIRSTVKRVCDKEVMVEIREKESRPGTEPRSVNRIITSAWPKLCLLDARKTRRLFLSGLWTRFENNLNFI